MATYKILIVDDDEDIRTGLNMRLRSCGFDTGFAQDAVSAVSQAKAQKPDLIILDLGLPAGDGLLVLKRLQAMADVSHIPIIVLSARDIDTNKQKALAAGAVAYFQKPADDQLLLQAINSALGIAA